MERLSSVGRLDDWAASACSSSSRLPPASGLSMPRIVLARVDLPEPDSPTRPEGLAVEQLEVDLDQRRHVVAALVEGLRHVVDRQRQIAVDRVLRRRSTAARRSRRAGRDGGSGSTGRRRRRRSAARPSGTARRRAGSGRRRRTSAGPSRSAGRLPGDRRQRPLATCGRRGAGSDRRRPSVYGCCGLREDGGGIALLDDLARVHHPDPVAHRPDDAEVVGDQQDRRVGLGLERADEVEHARLDGRVEPGRRLVEDEQLRVRGQRDRDDDALLHPARELVRVALGDAPPGRRSGPAGGRCSALSCACFAALAEDGERLDDLRADLGRRVERRAGVLVDHRGVVDPELADLVVAHLGDVVAIDEDRGRR